VIEVLLLLFVFYLFIFISTFQAIKDFAASAKHTDCLYIAKTYIVILSRHYIKKDIYMAEITTTFIFER